MIEEDLPSLVAKYKKIHAAPELSHYEEETAKLFSSELSSFGYAVHKDIGKYARPEWRGHGVVGMIANGDGPTVMVRADMDALPIEETTNLPYASQVRKENDKGQSVGVMHACGHDIHVTCALGTARAMANLRDAWSGTLLIVGQPAEETIDGAQAMLAAGIYERFPKPDYALALHTYPPLGAGSVGYTPGFFLASVNSIDLTIRGVGGHGSAPELSKDPIVIAAQVITALQTIVSREISPLDSAVVSIGSIHGGTRYNIIPDLVHLQLTVRAYKDDVRRKILAAIERICNGVAMAAGVPTELLPIMKVSDTEFAPATYNDPDLTLRLADVFRTSLGAQRVVEMAPLMGSEDFGQFGLESREIPTFMFFIGAGDPQAIADGKPQSLHSSNYAPIPEPTIRTGVKAMTSAVLDLMSKRPFPEKSINNSTTGSP